MMIANKTLVEIILITLMIITNKMLVEIILITVMMITNKKPSIDSNVISLHIRPR